MHQPGDQALTVTILHLNSKDRLERRRGGQSKADSLQASYTTVPSVPLHDATIHIDNCKDRWSAGDVDKARLAAI